MNYQAIRQLTFAFLGAILLISLVCIHNTAAQEPEGINIGPSGVTEGQVVPLEGDGPVIASEELVSIADTSLGGTNEPAIAINPLDANNIAAASLFSLRVSTDNGATFSAATSAAVPATHGLCGDPSLAFDSQGRLFWTYLGCRTNNSQFDIFVAQVNPATGAIIAGYPINVTAAAGFPASTSGNSNDKEWLAVDHFPGSPFQDQLYVVWTRFTGGGTVVHATFSNNQGLTWSPALTLSAAGEGFVWPTHNAVAPNGDVYVTYHSQPGFSGSNDPDGGSGQVFVLRSTDGGATFPQKTVAYTGGNADITFNVQTGARTLNSSVSWTQGSAQPWVLPDPGNPNNVYIVAADDPTNLNHGAGFDDMDIFIVRSTNQGLTWNAPAQVNGGPIGTTQFFPAAAIDDTTHCLTVMWYDMRAGLTNGNSRFLLDVFLRSSLDGGLTFGPEVQFNTVQFDPDLGAGARFAGPPPTLRIGEYNGVAVANGRVSAVWTGNTGTGQQMIFDSIIDCPSLSVTKTDDPDPVIATHALSYTITLTNDSPIAATSVVITDTLDPNVTFVSASDGGVQNAGIVTWDIGNIPPNNVIVRSLLVTVGNVTSGTLLSNFVMVGSAEGATAIYTETTTVVTGGKIIVNACNDQNADRDCDDSGEVILINNGVEACLNDVTNCKPVPATFEQLSPGTYLVFLRFVDASQGYYPTTPKTPITVTLGQTQPITMGAVYPVHPTGIAVHPSLKKVYAAFQGPKMGNEERPYPFVAVMDSGSDEVLYTLGGPNGIGRQPWGVAVSGDNVYVGSYGEGRVDVINANTDVVMANVTPNRADFRPAAPAVNPANGQVHFPDTRGRRLVILNGTSIVADRPLNFLTDSFRPLEVAVSPTGSQGYTYMSMRLSNGAQTVGIAETGDVEAQAALPGVTSLLPPPLSFNSSYATALWPQSGPPEPRLFVTYAANSRPGDPYPNPNRLVIYSFNPGNPNNLLQRQANIPIGDYAEAGLIFDPTLNRMLGTYGGFAYDQTQSDAGACGNSARGGIYGVDGVGNVVNGIMPALVVGNPPLITSTLQWRNPFELALNPNNGKVYVTDRCWNEFPAPGGGLTGGAVLAFNHSAVPVGGPLPPPIVSPAEAPVTVVPIEPTVTTTPIPTDLPEPTVTPEPTSTPVMVVPVEPTLEPEPITAPTSEPAPDGTVLLSGQVTLASSQGEASVTLEDTGQSVTTDVEGFFSLSGITEGPYNSITADAPGHLPATCAQPTVVGPETRLAVVTLLSGDLDDNNQVDIADLTLAVSNYGQTGSDLAADLNADGAVNIFDLQLIAANFGQGVQVWSCQ